jgi:hypothetical protein
VRHSSCLEIKRVFAKFQALGAARTKRRESGQISRESVALPEIPSKPGQISSRVREPFQPWRCAYFRSAPAAIMRSG